MSLSLLDDCNRAYKKFSNLFTLLAGVWWCTYLYSMQRQATYDMCHQTWAFTRLYIEHSMLFLFSPYQLTTMCIRTSGNQTLPERSEPCPKTCQVHVPHQGIEPSLSNAAKTALDWGYQTCTWCVRHALNENTSSSVWLQLENLVGQDVEFRFAKVAEGRSWDVGECTK